MRGLAYCGVFHAQVAADTADHDLPGIDPNANLDGYPVRGEHLLGVAPDGILHAQGRVASSHGVVLLRKRRTEQRHDAIAHHLVDGAVVVVHGLHHAFDHRLEQGARLLRIAFGEQLHRALQVSEQDRNLLSLALDCGLR